MRANLGAMIVAQDAPVAKPPRLLRFWLCYGLTCFVSGMFVCPIYMDFAPFLLIAYLISTAIAVFTPLSSRTASRAFTLALVGAVIPFLIAMVLEGILWLINLL